MIITVHHLELSRSSRVLWMLEELGLDYEIKEYKRNPKTFRAPPEMKETHPLGRSPQVEVDGRVLMESGAVLEYFADREGKLKPTDHDGLVEYRFWMHYAEGSVMPPLLIRLIMGKLREAPLPFFLKPIVKGIAQKVDDGYPGPEIERHFSFMDDILKDREYFVGDVFTAADIQMIYPVAAGLTRGAGDRPHIQAWLDRVQSRPAYLRTIERGGPLLPE